MRLGAANWRNHHPLFYFDGAGGGGGAGEPPADDSDIDKMDELDDAGKRALRAERRARRDAANALRQAEDARKEMESRLAALEKEKSDRAADEQKRADDAAKESGEYKTLAEKYERDLNQAKADLAEATKERDALKETANAIVKADFESLPEEIRAFYSGAADDPVAIMAFVPKAKELAAKLPGGAENDSKGVEGAKPNPPANGGVSSDPKADEAARAANASRYAF